MATALLLTVGLVAWIAFIYVQFYFGDRPTSPLWFSAMVGLGIFEYGKGMFALIEYGQSALPVAAALTVVSTSLLYAYMSRVAHEGEAEVVGAADTLAAGGA